MNVTYACPSCQHAQRAELDVGQPALHCGGCGQDLPIRAGAVEGREIHRCVVCGSHDLFVAKDFPQKLGAAIVVLGLAASCVPWYLNRPLWAFGVLFATAAVDLVLFWVMGDALCCYSCHARYRAAVQIERHGRFSLETHERYRQQAARLAALAERRP